MNAALKDLTAVLAKGGAHLGDVVFWSLSEATTNRSDLESKWKAAQLPMELLPEPPTIVKSFKLAVRETQTGLTDRLIRVAVDDEASVVFAIVHEARHADGTLVYTQEAKVGLELLTGTINTDAATHDLKNKKNKPANREEGVEPDLVQWLARPPRTRSGRAGAFLEPLVALHDHRPIFFSSPSSLNLSRCRTVDRANLLSDQFGLSRLLSPRATSFNTTALLVSISQHGPSSRN